MQIEMPDHLLQLLAKFTGSDQEILGSRMIANQRGAAGQENPLLIDGELFLVTVQAGRWIDDIIIGQPQVFGQFPKHMIGDEAHPLQTCTFSGKKANFGRWLRLRICGKNGILPHMKYVQFFSQCIHEKGSFLCVGIDPDPAKLPGEFERSPEGILAFVRQLIEQTHDLTPAYKLNLAFFERWGWRGWQILETVLTEIPDDILTIGDAKRGDIGNSSRFYAEALLETLSFDAVTLSPYLGSESIAPFIEDDRKGAFVLCVTSNASGRDLQDHGTDFPLYRRTADIVNGLNERENLGLVVGATKPEQLSELRLAYPKLPFLIPGVGKQGGAAQAAVEACRANGLGLINVSRGISYPAEGVTPGNIRAAAVRYAKLFQTEK